jgi:hypothetical protein
VKEQSHKNEMRAALRGDFERLRARREDGAAPDATQHLDEPLTQPEPAPAGDPLTEQVAAVPEPSRPSWLDRLLDRR